MPTDMDVRQQMKITNFFLTITEWDRHIELTRQFLNAMESFEPYAAYLRLNEGTGEPITAENVAKFLKENGFRANLNNLRTVIRMFDSRIKDSLDFEDFLRMILSRDNPDLRFNAVSNPTYEVDFGQKLSDQIEYTMAQFFLKASGFLDRIARDDEVQSIIKNPDLFAMIDAENTGALDFENLQDLFRESKIQLRETELIAILRAIDITDDGLIDRIKLDYFLSLCQGQEPSLRVTDEIKARGEDTDKTNFFGEKPEEDKTKSVRQEIQEIKEKLSAKKPLPREVETTPKAQLPKVELSEANETNQNPLRGSRATSSRMDESSRFRYINRNKHSRQGSANRSQIGAMKRELTPNNARQSYNQYNAKNQIIPENLSKTLPVNSQEKYEKQDSMMPRPSSRGAHSNMVSNYNGEIAPSRKTSRSPYAQSSYGKVLENRANLQRVQKSIPQVGQDGKHIARSYIFKSKLVEDTHSPHEQQQKPTQPEGGKITIRASPRSNNRYDSSIPKRSFSRPKHIVGETPTNPINVQSNIPAYQKADKSDVYVPRYKRKTERTDIATNRSTTPLAKSHLNDTSKYSKYSTNAGVKKDSTPAPERPIASQSAYQSSNPNVFARNTASAYNSTRPENMVQGGSKLSAYERSKMRQLAQSKVASPLKTIAKSELVTDESVPQSNPINKSHITPTKPTDHSQFSYNKSGFKGRKYDRSLRYDPDASPTKNLTASKKDRTTDKEPPLQKENESRRLTYSQKPEPKNTSEFPKYNSQRNAAYKPKYQRAKPQEGQKPTNKYSRHSRTEAQKSQLEASKSKANLTFYENPKLRLKNTETSRNSSAKVQRSTSKSKLRYTPSKNLSDYKRPESKERSSVQNSPVKRYREENHSAQKSVVKVSEEQIPFLLQRMAEGLENIIETQRNLEYCKQELALLPDYNLKDNFVYLNQGEGITLPKFQAFLNELEITEARNQGDVESIFENSDFDKDKVINEEEWNHILTPLQKEYRILLNCRTEQGVHPGAKFSEVFNEQVVGALKQVLSHLILSHKLQEKAIIEANIPESAIDELFRIIDTNNNKYLTLEEMKAFLLKNNIDIDEDSDVEILLNTLDLDRDGRVSNRDFAEFFGF